MAKATLLGDIRKAVSRVTRGPNEAQRQAAVGGGGPIPIQKLNIMFQACNLTCPMCSVNVNNTEIGQILRDYPDAATGPQLRLDEYKRALDDVRDQNPRGHKPVISIAGGEPTYFPYLVDLVEYARKELEFPVGLTTNGTLLNESQLERLAACGIGITISLDGMRETHDSIRGEGNYDKAINLLKLAVKLKKEKYPQFSVYSLFCIQECNQDEMSEVARHNIEEIGVDCQTMSYYIFAREDTLAAHEAWRKSYDLPETYRIDLLHGGEASKSDFSDFDFAKIYANQVRIVDTYQSRVNFEPHFRSEADLVSYFTKNEPMKEYFGNICAPSHLAVNLLSNGDVLFYPQCFQIKLGNVREQSVVEMWMGDQMNEIRETLGRSLSPICAHCCANRLNKNEHLLHDVGIDPHRFRHAS